jgi:hypothetical protein
MANSLKTKPLKFEEKTRTLLLCDTRYIFSRS